MCAVLGTARHRDRQSEAGDDLPEGEFKMACNSIGSGLAVAAAVVVAAVEVEAVIDMLGESVLAEILDLLTESTRRNRTRNFHSFATSFHQISYSLPPSPLPVRLLPVVLVDSSQ